MPNVAAAIRVLLVVVGTLAVTSSAAAAKPRITLVIGMERGVPPDAAARWNKLLTDRGVDDVQLRSKQAGDAPEIQTAGTANSRSFRVTGLLSAQNVLQVPGGKFGLSDAAGLEKWLNELGNNGVEGVTQKKTAFGLTPTQFATVHEDLQVKLVADTKGVVPMEALSAIRRRVKLAFSVDATVKEVLTQEPPVREELSGIAAGTAIAAVLRPAGLVLVPIKAGGTEPQYLITSGKDVKEFWPIGWPSEKAPKELVPTLFEFLNVELEDIAASEALAALQGRVKIPFLYDYNGMARQKIDLTQKKVKVPERKTYYQKAIQHVAQQAGLKQELRVDEAEQPFMWFTPIRGGP